jgi:WD40 repeat protein/transcriptional regulator with XRE-family HTH domain
MTHITLGDLLRRHRLEASLTQKELANLVGYDHTGISRFERSTDRSPQPDFIERFIEALHLPAEEAQQVWNAYRGETSVSAGLLEPTFCQDWGEAPDVSTFYGRYDDLVTLTHWLADEKCRLIVLLGMGGIGKTALATKLARQSADKFKYVLWRSLRNAPPLRELLTECIQFLSDQQETGLLERTDKAITRLIHYLAAQRSLLVLDNAEAILQEGQAGHYRPGYGDYGQLFQRLGESEHKSCIIVTSREKPREVGQLEGEDVLVRSHLLAGLQMEEGRQILAGKRLTGSDEAWGTLVQHYSGNPLALNIVAEMIREVYAGDIDDFLVDEAIIFGRIGDVLGEQFARLSALEQSLMYWLAIEREPVSREVLHGNLVGSVSNRDLIVALRSLRRRSLIEQIGAEFTLQNVVMEYVTDRLIERMCEEISTQQISLFDSHALVKAQVKTYVRNSQVRLLLRPVVERLQAIFTKEELEERLKYILAFSREKHAFKPSYLGGNEINLLCHFGWKLSSFDFSHLMIRQAYLQGMELQDVNFTNSNLADSVFTETFALILTVAFSPDDKLLAIGTTEGEIIVRQADHECRTICGMLGHTGWVQSVVFSPNGKIIASGGNDQTVRLWNAETGQEIDILNGHMDRVRFVVFSPNGQLIASGSDDRTIRVWDINSGRCLNTLTGHPGQIRSIAFSPDGYFVAGGSNEEIWLWDVETGHHLKTLHEQDGWVRTVAFHPAGGILAANAGNAIKLWDQNSGECLKALNGHQDTIVSIVYSPNGRILASGSRDGTVRLWEVGSGQCLRVLQEHASWIEAVNFSSDGQMIASCSESNLSLWEVETGECIQTIQGYTNSIWSVTFDPIGYKIVTSSDDNTVRLWDAVSGQCLKTMHGHTSWVWWVTFSSDGHKLASCSHDKTLRIWDPETGECLKAFEVGSRWFGAIAFSPDNQTIVTSCDDRAIRIWDINTEKSIRTFRGHSNWIRAVTFSPDGCLVASGGDETIRLWNVNLEESILILTGHTKQVTFVNFSPDGKTIASASLDHTIRLWDVETGKCCRVFRGHNNSVRSVAFSPDGKTLASGSSDHTVRLWNIITGETTKILYGHGGWVRSVAFSPNGEKLVTGGSRDGRIRVWNLATGKVIKILQADRPYERMNITGATGLTEAQRASLIALGAIDEERS